MLLLSNRLEPLWGKSTLWDDENLLFNAKVDGVFISWASRVVETILSVVKGIEVVHFSLIFRIFCKIAAILACLFELSILLFEFLGVEIIWGDTVVQVFRMALILWIIADIFVFFFLGSQDVWSTGYWNATSGLAFFTTLRAAWRWSGDKTRDRDRILKRN